MLTVPATSSSVCACLRNRWSRFPWRNSRRFLSKNREGGKRKRNSHSRIDHGEWKATVGLEIHAQIAADSKMFSGSSTVYGQPINTNVSLFDAAIPGTLPVLNRRCVEAGVITALAFNCKINKVSKFDRKHYFYADLPTGYQITQQRQPLANGGGVEYWVFEQKYRPEAYKKSTKIYQLQLEQDSGKSLHDSLNKRTLVDLNRAGVGLMEIVTEPNLSDGFEAASLVKEIASVVKAIGSCEGEMEKGHLRVDANVSVSKSEELGVRAEVKNLNSFKFVRQAIEYEIRRQIELREKGEEIVNETRTFDYVSRKTVGLRDKEELQDYRYMPEPNLPPLRCQDSEENNPNVVNICEIKRKMPVLQSEIREKWINEFGVPPGDALFILNDDAVREYFEKCIENVMEDAIPLLTEWMMYILRKWLKFDYGLTLDKCPVSPLVFSELITELKEGKITENAGKQVLKVMLKEPSESAKATIEKLNMWKLMGTAKIVELCSPVGEAENALAESLRKGKRPSADLRALTKLISVRNNYRIELSDIEETLRNRVLKIKNF